jgi:hypothetical protein
MKFSILSSIFNPFFSILGYSPQHCQKLIKRLYFFAGSDTSSITLSYALIELSYNPKVQEKLRKEIKEKIASSNGVITYKNSQEMT